VRAEVKQTESTLASEITWRSISGQRAVKLTQITDSRTQFRAGGDPDRCKLQHLLRDGGCIVRPHEGIVVRRSGGFDRPQFGAAKNAVKLTTLSGLRRALFVTKDEPS
jgi:hypothetical protein